MFGKFDQVLLNKIGDSKICDLVWMKAMHTLTSLYCIGKD